jgi:putative transposase
MALQVFRNGSRYSGEQFQRLMADSGIVCSMSRSGNV